MTPRLTLRTVLTIGALIGLLVLILVVLSWCSDRKRLDAERASRTIADGRTAAAQDASQVRDANDAANSSTRNEVKEATDAVRNETDPAERDAIARRRLCRLNPGACAR